MVLTSNTEILNNMYVVGSQLCLYRTTSHLGAHKKKNIDDKVPPQTKSESLAGRISISVFKVFQVKVLKFSSGHPELKTS